MALESLMFFFFSYLIIIIFIQVDSIKECKPIIMKGFHNVLRYEALTFTEQSGQEKIAISFIYHHL